MRLATVALAVTLVLACAPLGATTNRFFNPDFDANTVGWEDTVPPAVPPRSVHDRNGCSRSGSVDPTLQVGWGFFSASVSQCVPVFQGEVLMAVADFRLSGLSDVGIAMAVQFKAGGCTSADGPRVDGPIDLRVPSGTWTTFPRLQFGVPSGMESAIVHFSFLSAGDFDVQVDRAFVGHPFEIADEDFERGYSCAFDWQP
jgi:hypothetical protein